jgi:hypothetical protein
MGVPLAILPGRGLMVLVALPTLLAIRGNPLKGAQRAIPACIFIPIPKISLDIPF